MIKIDFHDEIDNELLKYAIIFAKMNGKWIFCRHKERDTLETPAGHREAGEDIFDTAKRELYEETGASEFTIHPICIYSVTEDDNTEYGKVFYADVKSLSKIPDFEISEIFLVDILPKNLTYPEVQPILFERVQWWLNIQSSADEIWDVYDENRNLTGRTHRRGNPLPKDAYHLVVHVWIKNSKGEFLITKRSPNKGHPNTWENTGGSAVAGDDSLTAAIREVKEETGLTVLPENGICTLKITSSNRRHHDVWLFKQDFDISDVVLQENETCDVKFATKDEIYKMYRNGEFVPFSYIDEFLLNY